MCEYSQFSKDSVVEALIEILQSKGIITNNEIRSCIDTINNKKNEQYLKNTLLNGKTELSILEQAEKTLILETLRDLDGNKSNAARRLGITRKTLQNKVKKYSLNK